MGGVCKESKSNFGGQLMGGVCKGSKSNFGGIQGSKQNSRVFQRYIRDLFLIILKQ